MGADYSFELISIKTCAPQFIGHNKLFLGSVYTQSGLISNDTKSHECIAYFSLAIFDLFVNKKTSFLQIGIENCKAFFIWKFNRSFLKVCVSYKKGLLVHVQLYILAFMLYIFLCSGKVKLISKCPFWTKILTKFFPEFLP